MNPEIAKSALEHETDRRQNATLLNEVAINGRTSLAKDLSNYSFLVLAGMLTVSTTRATLIKTLPLFIISGILFALCILFTICSRIIVSGLLSDFYEKMLDRYIEVASKTRIYISQNTKETQDEMLKVIQKKYPEMNNNYISKNMHKISAAFFISAAALLGISIIVHINW